MMECTDRHDRYFLRLITRRTLLYSEMVTTGALIHGDRDRLLAFDAAEHPVAIQLGGSDPGDLATCARLAEARGFDEINLNVGCPSDRVQSGRFGACLMAEPELVAKCVGAMRDAVSVPVTVKTRIGINDRDSYEHLAQFVTTVALGGVQTFIVHARKAWLDGMSPKENRTVPPLRYDEVYRLKRDFPELGFVINGGITGIGEVRAHLARVDGAMIGREAYANPYLLAQADAELFGDHRPVPSREAIIEAYLPYVQRQLDAGVYLSRCTRHIIGLFQGIPGARAWRRHLSEHACRPGADLGVIRDALVHITEAALRQQAWESAREAH
jgi:tRNA-dihydrouridine synthase A